MEELQHCNDTLHDRNYTNYFGKSCVSADQTFYDVCYAPTDDDILCNSTGYIGAIIAACINYCRSCPHFLFGMERSGLLPYLEIVMGYPAQESGLFFSVVLASLCIFGSIANFLTIVVILRNKVLQATSHYLLSLALSDLLMLMATAPTEIKFQIGYWPWKFPQFFCRLHPYIKEACLYTTVLHIAAFTIERYIVICHPMRARTILSRSRALKIITLIWFWSFLLAIPVFVVHSVGEFCEGIPETTVCHIIYEFDEFLKFFYGVASIILFFVPMTLILVLYSLIARALFVKNLTSGSRRSTISKISKRNKVTTSDAVEKARQHAVKLLALVAVSFFVLWFPFMWIRFKPLFTTPNEDEERTYHEWHYSISMSLLYLSSCTNPVLYNVLSARFRKAYKSTILCRDVRSSRMRDGSMYSKYYYRTDTTPTSATNFTAL